jgi:hypothetical protein
MFRSTPRTVTTHTITTHTSTGDYSGDASVQEGFEGDFDYVEAVETL